MRIERDSLDTEISSALKQKRNPSGDFEAALFAEAEDLLAKRREQRDSREDRARRKSLARKRWLAGIELLAIRPDRPATAAVLAALLVAFLALHDGGGDRSGRLSYADLPPLPEDNDFAAQYDSQVLAERQAYEREVEDAHGKASGGI
ncbi:MAG: hypothetical protein NDJ89_13115 [Oligoflexia bacterium]|nr:hypothetical protein [Oligoflexia bacterium]